MYNFYVRISTVLHAIAHLRYLIFIKTIPVGSWLSNVKLFWHAGICSLALQVNCETDFVAKNEQFKKLVSSLTSTCFEIGKDGNKLKVIPELGFPPFVVVFCESKVI